MKNLATLNYYTIIIIPLDNRFSNVVISAATFRAISSQLLLFRQNPCNNTCTGWYDYHNKDGTVSKQNSAGMRNVEHNVYLRGKGDYY